MSDRNDRYTPHMSQPTPEKTPDQPFGIGQVLGVCLSIMGGNIGRLSLIVVLSQISVLAVFAIAMTPILMDVFDVIARTGQGGQINTDLMVLSLMSRFSFVFVILAIAGIIAHAFSTSVCAYGSHVALETEEKMPLLGSLGKGFRRLLPAAGITLLFYVTSFIIVGGLWGIGLTFAISTGSGLSVASIAFVLSLVAFALVAWLGVRISVSVPATVVEGLGVLDSLRRSLDLTKGYGWAIFCVLLVIFVGTFIAALIAQFLLSLLPIVPVQNGDVSMLFVGVQLINMMIGMALYGPVLAALGIIHNRLVYLKDGASPPGVAAVFD